MKILVKRVYDKADKADGVRVLVDRLWPRGMSKRSAKIDEWAKELTPSTALRTWYHAHPKEYSVFRAKYRSELANKKEERAALLKGKRTCTLVSAVRDIEHSHVPILLSFLKKGAH